MANDIYLYDNFPLDGKLTPEFLDKAGGIDNLISLGLIKRLFYRKFASLFRLY